MREQARAGPGTKGQPMGHVMGEGAWQEEGMGVVGTGG